MRSFPSRRCCGRHQVSAAPNRPVTYLITFDEDTVTAKLTVIFPSAGLQATGPSNGDCSSSTGQVYSRSAAYSNGDFAIMYAWYWPKDEPTDVIGGHRHDWESVVVWLNGAQTKVVGAAASQHGGFVTTTTPNFSGNTPLFVYASNGILDHDLDFTSTVGGQQPLIAYESLPAVALAALENTDWGSANVPFTDNNFLTNLGEAAL